MYSGSCRPFSDFAYGVFTLSDRPSQTFRLSLPVTYAVRTPQCTHHGLGSFGFARRYSQNRVFFLLLRLLRCFSSPGSLCNTMDSCYSTWGFLMWVSPFRYLRIFGYLLLPEAFRSLSRLSSALSAKASTMRSSLLDHVTKLLPFNPGTVRNCSTYFFVSVTFMIWCIALHQSHKEKIYCL